MSGVDLGLMREVAATLERDAADSPWRRERLASRLLVEAADELRVLREIVDPAETYARHDPGVDFPGPAHADPVSAICAALDDTREAHALAGEERGAAPDAVTLALLRSHVRELEVIRDDLRALLDADGLPTSAGASGPHAPRYRNALDFVYGISDETFRLAQRDADLRGEV